MEYHHTDIRGRWVVDVYTLLAVRQALRVRFPCTMMVSSWNIAIHTEAR